MPNFIVSLLLLSLIVIFLKNTIFNYRGVILYFVTLLLLFHATIQVSVSYLMLEPTTTFFLFKVHHPLPIEYYTQYLNNCLNNVISMNPHLLEESSLQQFQEYIQKNLEQKDLRMLNAQQIESYATELCKNYNEELAKILQPKEHIFDCLGSVFTASLIPKVIPYIYELLKNH